MIVSFDFHGAVANTDEAERNLLGEMCDEVIIPASVSRRAGIVGKEFLTIGGKKRTISLEEFEAMRDELYQNQTLFARRVPPMQGVKKVWTWLRELETNRPHLQIVTNAGFGHPIEDHDERERHKDRIRAWLKYNEMWIHERDINVGGPKTRLYAESDVVVDNEIGHLQAVQESGNKTTMLILKLSPLTAHLEHVKNGEIGRIIPVRKWTDIQYLIGERLSRRAVA